MRTMGKATPVFVLSVATGALFLSGCQQTAGVVMNRSGMGYHQTGNYALAAQEFRSALTVEPNNADYAANLALSLQKSGDTVGAEKMYRRALAANPTHRSTYREYSRMLAGQNRSAEAMALMQQYVGTSGYQVEPHIELAELHRELGNRTGEAHALQQALKVSPKHPTALAELGRYFQDMGQTKTAMKMYQQSLQANYAQPEVQSRFASLQGQVQQEKQARATLANLQKQHQQTAAALKSYQHQNQTRIAASTRRQAARQIVRVPQPAYVQAPMTRQATANPYQMASVPGQQAYVPQQMTYRPTVSSAPIQHYATQPTFDTLPMDGPYVTQDSGAYFEETTPTYTGEYEIGETIAFPTEVSAADSEVSMS